MGSDSVGRSPGPTGGDQAFLRWTCSRVDAVRPRRGRGSGVPARRRRSKPISARGATHRERTARQCDERSPSPPPPPRPPLDQDVLIEAGLARYPALTFGPRPDANGNFSWGNGDRLYYANLVANLGGSVPRSFKGLSGCRALAHGQHRLGGRREQRRMVLSKVISRQSSTTFSDKEQIWADNASSVCYFGTVYVCWAAFMSAEHSPDAIPAGLQVAVSHDGGTTWKQHPIGSAANNGQKNPLDGCTGPHGQRGNRLCLRYRNEVTGEPPAVRVDVEVDERWDLMEQPGRRRRPGQSTGRFRPGTRRRPTRSTAWLARGATCPGAVGGHRQRGTDGY